MKVRKPPHRRLFAWQVWCACRMVLCWSLVASALTLLQSASGCAIVAQEPSEGKEPVDPPQKFPQVLGGGVKPDAFYSIDKNGFRIMLPGMTFEEIDRLQKAAGGYVLATKPYTFERVSIEGSADDSRADLTITFIINFAASNENKVIIPLQMQGFHIQGPADVVGVEEYGFDFSPSRGGHLLWVRPDQPRSIEVRMRAVSRVNSESGTGLSVDLPLAPTTLTMNIRGGNLDASVVGRGDEVVEVSPSDQGKTKIKVECSGGLFTLNWRSRDESRPSDQVLEVTSRLRLNWEDPQTPPSAIAELEVTNRRGALSSFEVVLPNGAELIEPVQNAPGVQIGSRDPRTGRIQVTPTDDDQLGRVKFAVEYRLQSGEYDAEKPLMIQPVEVPAAVRHSGDLEIRTDRNFRVRWLQSSMVRSIRRPLTGAEASDPRIYLFQFDRTGFEVPIWLSTKRQPVRIEPEYSILLNENAATLKAKLLVAGTLLEGLPLIVDVAGWKTTAVQDLESGREIPDPLSAAGENLELELAEATVGMNNQFGFVWTAERSIDAASGNVHFALPRLRSLDDRAILISPGVLTLQCEGGVDVFLDSEKSRGLVRAANVGASENSKRLSLRIQTVDTAPEFHGYLVESPPEVNLESNVEFIVSSGNQVRTIVDWTILPKDDLRGQIPVRLPTVFAGEAKVAEEGASQWQVTVNGQVAVLRAADETSSLSADIIVYSDQLGRDQARIQWNLLQDFPDARTIATASQEPEEQEISIDLGLPVLALPLTNNGLTSRIRFVEEAGWSLTLIHRGETTLGPLDLTTDSRIRLLVQPRTAAPERNAVLRNSLIRSEIGRQRRFDRLVAELGGEGSILPLSMVTWNSGRFGQEVTAPIIQVEVDGEPWERFRSTRDGLEISLDESQTSRRIEVRVWQTRAGERMAETLKPAFLLPLSTGKTYWDVVLTADQHLVWNAPSASPLMSWRYDRMSIQRIADRSYADLVTSLGATSGTESVAGNRYLFVTSDATSLRISSASRALLWTIFGGGVLLISTLILQVPVLRHPIFAICGAILLAGLAWNTPDIAVIAGQLTLLAMGLVSVMLGVRAILLRRPRATILGGIVEESSQSAGSAIRSKAPEPASTRLPDAVVTGSTAGTPS